MFKIFVSGSRDRRADKLKAAKSILALGYAPYLSGESDLLVKEGVADHDQWDKVDAEFAIECDAFLTVDRDGDPHYDLAVEYGKPVFASIPEVIQFLSEDHPMFSSVDCDDDY